jgi:hypothetical protein
VWRKEGCADFKIEVVANPPPAVFIRSSAITGGTWWGTDAWLDEDDVNMSGSASGRQYPVVHEFGHLLGLSHPGKPGTPTEYTADAPALMGEGMEMRAAYFQKWADFLSSRYSGSGNWIVR